MQAVPDAVVLDVGLPGIDGLEVCRRVRLLGNRVPILILTARDAVADRIDGLDVGADDYMVKPFDVGELKARLRALLRRASPDGDPDELSFAEVRLDAARHGAQVGENFVELTRTEYQLLELLMLNPRRVLSHSLIYDRVWGYDFGPASNAMRVYVGYLRRKLEERGRARADPHGARRRLRPARAVSRAARRDDAAHAHRGGGEPVGGAGGAGGRDRPVRGGALGPARGNRQGAGERAQAFASSRPRPPARGAGPGAGGPAAAGRRAGGAVRPRSAGRPGGARARGTAASRAASSRRRSARRRATCSSSRPQGTVDVPGGQGASPTRIPLTAADRAIAARGSGRSGSATGA